MIKLRGLMMAALVAVTAACDEGESAVEDVSTSAIGQDVSTGDVSAAPAAGGTGRFDGSYLCQHYLNGMVMNLGTIDIAGDRYEGLSPGNAGSFSASEEGGLVFQEPMSGVPEGYSIQGAAGQVRDDGSKVLSLYIQSARSGNSTQVVCEQRR